MKHQLRTGLPIGGPALDCPAYGYACAPHAGLAARLTQHGCCGPFHCGSPSTSRSDSGLRRDPATMQAPQARRAATAAMAIGSSLGLATDDAIVLHNSNKLTLRLLPGDVLARVAPAADQVAQFEIELAQRLAAAGSPVAALDPRVEPRVYEQDGFVVTLWTYY